LPAVKFRAVFDTRVTHWEHFTSRYIMMEKRVVQVRKLVRDWEAMEW
jgi:hypothetical protein